MAGVGEPPPPGEWPEVRTDGLAPAPDPVHPEEGTVVVRPPEVIAHGSVTGIPWAIQAWETGPAPGAKWWEVMVAVGPEMEFSLGAHGFLGGGGVQVRVPEGHALTASGHFFGRVPHVIAWVGVVANEVARLEVRLEDGRSRNAPLHPALEGMPRFFWFFPPRGVPAEIVTYERGGRVLERAALPEPKVRPNANAGTGINPEGWRAGEPPPGWPTNEHEFAPGEGPRRDEDFLLHIAPFPIFVLPPGHWEGLVSLGGHSGEGGPASYVPTRIELLYLDRLDEPTRGLLVVSVDPHEADRHEELYPPHREEGMWWFDAGTDDIPQLPGRFVGERHEAVEVRRLRPGRRYLGQDRLSVGGAEATFERWEYHGFPELIEFRLRLPEAALRVESWNLAERETLHLAGRLERLELGSELLRRMTEASEAATRAREGRHRPQHPE